jgi:hypothetical protein
MAESFNDAEFTPAPPAFNDAEFAKPAKPPGTVGYLARQAAAGLTADLPQIAGKALQYTGAPDDALPRLGARMRAFGEANAAQAQPDDTRGPITRFAAGAIRGAAPIVPLAAAGLAAQGTPLGPAIDLAGAAALGGAFGGAQAQDTLEKGRAAGLSDEEATSVARKTGAITGLGMGAVGALTGGAAAPVVRALATGGARTAGEVLTNAAAPSIVRPLAAEAVGHLAGNTASMAAANAGVAATEQAAGLPGPTPGQAALEGVESGVGLTAALLPFGAVRSTMGQRANSRAVADLQSASTDPATRVGVADRIQRNLQAVDPEAAQNFGDHARAAIVNGQALDIGEHLLRPPTEGQYQPAAPAAPAEPAVPAGPMERAATLASAAGKKWQDIAPTQPADDLAAQKAATEVGQQWQNIAPTEPAADLAAQREQAQRESEQAGAAASRETDARIAAVGQQWQDLGITQPADDLQRQRAGFAPEPGPLEHAAPTFRFQEMRAERQAGEQPQGEPSVGVPQPQSETAPAPIQSEPIAAQPAEAPAATAFVPETGTLGVPRADMPQVQTVHHGALVNFLGARGIEHQTEMVDPGTLKPTQAEYIPEKVQSILDGEKQGDGAILVSSDGHILDGHHQALAQLAKGEPIKAIRLDAPIADLIAQVKEFPSAQVSTDTAAQAAAPVPAPAAAAPQVQPQPDRGGAPVAAGAGVEPNGALTPQAPIVQPPPTLAAKMRAKAGGLSVGTTPKATEPVTVQAGVVHIGKYAAVHFETGEPVRVADGASEAQIKQALRDSGALGQRQKFYGGQEASTTAAAVPQSQAAASSAPTIKEPSRAEVPKPQVAQAPVAAGTGSQQAAAGAAAAKPGAGEVQAPRVERPANWRGNFMQATQVGKSVGIPYVQGRKLADLLAMIDAKDGQASATSGTAEGLSKLLGKAVKREAMESQGRNVLDDMAEANESPRDVADKFWRETYFKLPAEAQARFKKMAQNHSGEDVLTSKDSPADVFDLPSSVEQLEGTERGFVVLMKEGNARFAEAAPEPAKALAAPESTHKEQGKPAEPASAPVESAARSEPPAVAPEQPTASAKPKVEGKEAPQAVKAPEGVKAGETRTAPQTGAEFARDTTPAEGQSLRPTQIQRAVDKLTLNWLKKPDIHILDTMADAPEPVRAVWERQNAQGAMGNIEGFHWRGGVYLVSDQMHSGSDIIRVLYHESLGHYGLRNSFPTLDPVLRQVARAKPEEMRTKALQYGLDLTNERQRMTAAEELLAEMAQTRPEIGFVRQAVAAIRTFLRENIPGFDSLKLTDDEIIRNFLAPARAFVENGKRAEPSFMNSGKAGDQGTNFSRAAVLGRATQAVDQLKDSPSAKNVSEAMDGIKRIVMPQARSDSAREVSRVLIEGMGTAEMKSIRFRAELNKAVVEQAKAVTFSQKARDVIEKGLTVAADKVFLNQSAAENHAFMQAMDSGDAKFFEERPDLKGMADVIGSMFAEKAKEVQALDTGAMQTIRENYFPHVWDRTPDMDKQQQIFTTLSKRPLEGEKGFTKQRVFEDVQAGLDAGFKPVSNNPLDLVALKMTEMDRYILAHRTLRAMEGSEAVRLIGASEDKPLGYSDINGRFGNIERDGKKLRYVGRDDVAQVINNFLSPSLYHNKYVGRPFSGYMKAANLLNQFQLGVFSAFHAGFTSLEAVISHAAIGVKALTEGDFKGAANYLASAPAAWINNPKMGSKIIQEMLNKGSHPEMAQIIEGLQLAGFKWQMDNRFRTDSTKQMLQSWSEGKKIRAGLNSITAITEQSARPILEWLVPRQKFGVFGEMYHRWIQQNPDATHEEMRNSAQQIWNRVDSRLGQVAYDRLFVHGIAKNVMQMLIRAPGWTGGTVLEVGGGMLDLGGYARDLAAGKKPAGISDRAAYVLSMVMVTAMTNSILTALFTGDAPEDWRDLVAFRTGNMDEHGRPERMVLPTYMKDVLAYAKQPGVTLLHKAHPALGLIGDIARNRDYHGTEIRSEDDNIFTQLAQTAGFTAKQFIPFWMQGLQKESEREGSALAMAAPVIGVMPAPSDLNKTAAEQLMSKYSADRLPQGTRTAEETEKADLHRKMYLAFRRDEPDKARALFEQGRDAGLFGAKDYLRTMRQARNDPLLNSFRNLTFPEARRVMEVATPDEQQQLRIPFARKEAAYRRQHAGADGATVD